MNKFRYCSIRLTTYERDFAQNSHDKYVKDYEEGLHKDESLLYTPETYSLEINGWPDGLPEENDDTDGNLLINTPWGADNIIPVLSYIDKIFNYLAENGYSIEDRKVLYVEKTKATIKVKGLDGKTIEYQAEERVICESYLLKVEM